MTDQAEKIEELRSRVDALETLVQELTDRLDAMHELTGDEKDMLKFLKRIDPLGIRIGDVERRLNKADIPD